MLVFFIFISLPCNKNIYPQTFNGKIIDKKSLKKPKEQYEFVNRRRTYNTMAKRKGQTTIYKT
jgi:hypothetical protein